MSQRQQQLNFPSRKISETFLAFAKPLLDAISPNPTEAEAKEPLKIAFTIWNAVVFADAVNDDRILKKVLASTTKDPQVAAVINQMIARKRSQFGDDHRLVGEYTHFRKGGEFLLRVEARDPRPPVGTSKNKPS